MWYLRRTHRRVNRHLLSLPLRWHSWYTATQADDYQGASLKVERKDIY